MINTVGPDRIISLLMEGYGSGHPAGHKFENYFIRPLFFVLFAVLVGLRFFCPLSLENIVNGNACPGGVPSVTAYTGRLRPKGVALIGLRQMKR